MEKSVKGNITRRGKNSFRLKFDAGRDASGKRKIHFVTFRGTKREAQIKLAELITAVDQSKYVEPNKVTIADWVRRRVDHWEASGEISARTAQRYRQLVEHQIGPHIGAKLLQKLRTHDVETWHTTLRTGGRVRGKGDLSARTIGHAHRVLNKALREAAKNELVIKNVVALEAAPKVPDEEMESCRTCRPSSKRYEVLAYSPWGWLDCLRACGLAKSWHSDGAGWTSTGK
jgi:hypothetical protein